MAWSDAARAAAAEMRRRKGSFSGKRLRPFSLYKGMKAPMIGLHLTPNDSAASGYAGFKGRSGRSAIFSTTSLKEARSYGKVVYKVSTVQQKWRNQFDRINGKQLNIASAYSIRAVRLPRLK